MNFASIMAVMADKAFVAQLTNAIKSAAAAGKSIAEGRAALARSAMAGDFDDVLRKVRASDDAVADYIENG